MLKSNLLRWLARFPFGKLFPFGKFPSAGSGNRWLSLPKPVPSAGSGNRWLSLPKPVPSAGSGNASQMGLLPLLAGVFLALGLWGALALRLPSETGSLELGRPSQISIQARRNVKFISNLRTSAERAKAENRPENLVMESDFSLLSRQRLSLDTLLTSISAVRADPTLNDSEKIQKLSTLPNASLAFSPTLAWSVIALDENGWNGVKMQCLTLYDRAVSQYAYELDQTALQQLQQRSLPYWTSGLAEPQRGVVLFFTTGFLRVNRVLNAQATEQHKREARAQIKPIEIEVLAGQSIIRSGEIVNSEIIELLEATGDLPKQLNWFNLAGLGLIASLLALIFVQYLGTFQPEIMQKTQALLVITTLLVLTALAARFLLPIWAEQPYAFPLATTILILSVIFDSKVALVSAIILSLIIGIIDGNTLTLAATMLLGSATAIFVVRGAERTLTFLLAGVGVAAVTTLTQLAFLLAGSGMLNALDLSALLFFSGLNGGLSAILALGSFNLVGRLAGVVTTFQLMELAHPSRPLLRKLIREAPGTYAHSLAVGNLAEAAAEAVGADALLLRVSAYYHDIGKTVRPFFFTENQLGRENIHNELDPSSSAAIIIDHVVEGLKIAQQHGLPPQVSAFITAHHGTNTVGNFYQLALQQKDSVEIKDFRYPGPRPATKEEGIMMLADTVEATVRSKAQSGKLILTQPKSAEGQSQVNENAQTLEATVNGIIDERIRSGQLNNTALTLHDLVLIKGAFLNTLQGIYHPRTDYAKVQASSLS